MGRAASARATADARAPKPTRAAPSAPNCCSELGRPHSTCPSAPTRRSAHRHRSAGREVTAGGASRRAWASASRPGGSIARRLACGRLPYPTGRRASVAAPRSTLSTPTPARPTTFSRPLAASMTARVTCAAPHTLCAWRPGGVPARTPAPPCAAPAQRALRDGVVRRSSRRAPRAAACGTARARTLLPLCACRSLSAAAPRAGRPPGPRLGGRADDERVAAGDALDELLRRQVVAGVHGAKFLQQLQAWQPPARVASALRQARGGGRHADPSKRTAPSARLAFYRHPLQANCRGAVLSTAKAVEIRALTGCPPSERRVRTTPLGRGPHRASPTSPQPVSRASPLSLQ